ncbi:hypothetical protein [Myceligenerans indicum]|uniref:Uncharacterized protein n=1 Tax=Myceligenerans indicum TaxID=2593663 RepID=A0ABS1LNK9_9MICO|nr:hypothetical protein [Myceligenerans indicum]MBL0887768.1 hypothetical protein [Myceligenerans indicum]
MAARVVVRALAVGVVGAMVAGGAASPAAAAGEGVPQPRALAGPPAASSVGTVRLPARVADGLAEASHSRYVYDTGSRTVRVTVSTTIRNVKPDQGLQYYFWDSYGIPVPTGAQDVRATSGGQSLSVGLEPTEDDFTKWAMASFSNLRYGQSRTIDWSYTIPGDPIRSEGYTRVGKGYATFVAQAMGDAGSVSVEIVAPDAMDLTTMAGDFTEKTADGTTTWSTSSMTDEYGIWSPVSLRDPDQADTTQVDVSGEDLTLLSFPGDKKWAKFVADRLHDGLPVVEKTIGQEWPGGLKEIREDVSPEIVGYAWYDDQREEIVIGEDLDEQLFYHELTHTWVNGSTLEGRWLVEGLTEAVARRVVEETGGKVDRPRASRDADGALALSTWNDLTQDFADVDHAVEDYAYAAAPATIETLVADLDDDEFTDLVSALLDGDSVYEQPGDKHVWGDSGWRQLLDLLEDRAGVDGAQKVLGKWVLTKKEKKELPKRAEEREQYFALDEADGEWNPPQGIRVRMTQWEFARAAEAREEIGADTPAAARRIQDAAAAAGFPDPAAAKEAYETAANGLDYTELAETMPHTADVTEQVSEAVQRIGAKGDPFTELGEIVLFAGRATDDAVQDLDAGNLDAAAQDAERASQIANLALWVGILLVLFVLGVALVVVRLTISGRRRRAARAALAAQAPGGSGALPQRDGPTPQAATETPVEEAVPERPLSSRSAAQLPPPLPLPPPTDPWHSEPEGGDEGR